MTPDEAVRIYQDKRASMNQEQMHGRPPFSEHEKCRAGLAAVLAEVDKDYVSRKGLIRQSVPREVLDSPVMDDIKRSVTARAKDMGASVPNIDTFQVIEPDPESFPFFADYVTLIWEIRRD